MLNEAERLAQIQEKYKAGEARRAELERQQKAIFENYTNLAQGLERCLQGCDAISNCSCTPESVRYAFDHKIVASCGEREHLTVLHLGAGEMKQVFSSSYALLTSKVKTVHAIVIEPELFKTTGFQSIDAEKLVQQMDTVVGRINCEKGVTNNNNSGLYHQFTPANTNNVSLRISRFTTVFSFYLACHPDREKIMQEKNSFQQAWESFNKKYPLQNPTKGTVYDLDMLYEACHSDQKNNAQIIKNRSLLRLDLAVSIDLQVPTEIKATLGDCFNGLRAAQTFLDPSHRFSIISCQQENEFGNYYDASSFETELHFPHPASSSSASKDPCCVM
jgi:hypothetical protein